jgi:hypothetical protein
LESSLNELAPNILGLVEEKVWSGFRKLMLHKTLWMCSGPRCVSSGHAGCVRRANAPRHM